MVCGVVDALAVSAVDGVLFAAAKAVAAVDDDVAFVAVLVDGVVGA